MNFLLEGPGGLPGTKQSRKTGTNLPFTFGSQVTNGGIASNIAAAALASAGTVSFVPANTVTTHTPTQAETINFTTTGYGVGTRIFLEIVTSGASSFTLTFGTGTKTTGTLATGTTTAKVFIVAFVFDGTNWVEVSRTTAM